VSAQDRIEMNSCFITADHGETLRLRFYADKIADLAIAPSPSAVSVALYPASAQVI